MNRRHFLQNSAALWALPSIVNASTATGDAVSPLPLSHLPPSPGSLLTPIDLSPARWIWYPMGRCLPSTVVLLRREIVLDAAPASATGRILAERMRVSLGQPVIIEINAQNLTALSTQQLHGDQADQSQTDHDHALA